MILARAGNHSTCHPPALLLVRAIDNRRLPLFPIKAATGLSADEAPVFRPKQA